MVAVASWWFAILEIPYEKNHCFDIIPRIGSTWSTKWLWPTNPLIDGCFGCFTRRRVRRRSPSIRERTSQRWHFIQISSASAWPSWTRLVGWFPAELWWTEEFVNVNARMWRVTVWLLQLWNDMVAATGEMWDQALQMLTASNSAITWLHGEMRCGKDIVSLMKKRVMDCRSWETDWELSLLHLFNADLSSVQKKVKGGHVELDVSI